MRKNIADLVKIGILVPAMIVSMAACGAANAQGASATEAEKTTEAAETTEATDAAAEEKAAEADAAAAQTAEPIVYENMGYKLTVPAELADKITVETPAENDDGVIFDAFETKSVEAAEAKGNGNLSYGWLFAITERDEETAHQILVDGIGGQQPIAKAEDGTYFIYNSPTDVRYERATAEEMEKDQAEWTAACDWANTVIKTFAEENSLTAIAYNGTQVETALARCAFQADVNYTISTLEHGPLAPNGVDPLPFYEKMTTGATYENIELSDSEKPDGEYVVLNFPDEEIRYDFMLGEGLENIIRMVTGPEGGEQYEYYYKVTFADGTTKASEVMHEWYNAIVEKSGIQ